MGSYVPATAELCQVFNQPATGAQGWLLNYSAVVFLCSGAVKAAGVAPVAQAVRRCSGDGRSVLPSPGDVQRLRSGAGYTLRQSINV